MSDESNVSIVRTAVGADPGLASFGLAGVSRLSDGSLMCRGVLLVRTEPDQRRVMRAGMTDALRGRVLYQGVADAVTLLRPDVIGVEQYSVFTPKGVGELEGQARSVVDAYALAQRQPGPQSDSALGDRIARLRSSVADSGSRAGVGLGQSAKTILVYGFVLACAYAYGVPVYVFTPGDAKRVVGGAKGASKDDVANRLLGRVVGLAEALEPIARGARNHCTDAMATAVMALEELERWHARGG